MLAAMGSKSKPTAPDSNTQARVIYDLDYEDPDFRQAYEDVVSTLESKGGRVVVGTKKAKIGLADLDDAVMQGLIERSAKVRCMLGFSADPRKWARDLVDRTLSGEMEPWEAPYGAKSPSAELHRYLRELKGHHAKLDKRYRRYRSLEKKLRSYYEELILFYLHPAPDPVVELCEHLIPKLEGKYSLASIKQLAGQIAGIVFPEQVGIGSFSKKGEVSMSKIAADIINRKKRYDAKRKDSPTGVRHGALFVDE